MYVTGSDVIDKSAEFGSTPATDVLVANHVQQRTNMFPNQHEGINQAMHEATKQSFTAASANIRLDQLFPTSIDKGGRSSLLIAGLSPIVSPPGRMDIGGITHVKGDVKHLTVQPMFEGACPLGSSSQHNLPPSLKVRRYSFLAGSRHGRAFSDIFNSSTLLDHFDQYSSDDYDDSGLGRDNLSTRQSTLLPTHVKSVKASSSAKNNFGANAKYTHTRASNEDCNSQPFARRRTVPSIVNEPKDNEQSSDGITVKFLTENSYISENGVQRPTESDFPPQNRKLDFSFSRRDMDVIRVAEFNKINNIRTIHSKGSLPNLKEIAKVQPMSRLEACRLGNKRRQELNRQNDLAERRRHGDVAVLMVDVKVSGTLTLR